MIFRTSRRVAQWALCTVVTSGFSLFLMVLMPFAARAQVDQSDGNAAGHIGTGWGLYSELANKTWLVIDKNAFNSFYIVKFRFEGDELVSDNVLYTAGSQIPSRSAIAKLADGRLQGVGTNSFGSVASDGSVSFVSRSTFGREKKVSSVRRVNSEIVSLFAAEPKRPFVYNQISDAEIPELVAQWHERREARERQREAASRARWDRFNAILSGVTTALSEVQQVTTAQAEESEARLSAARARVQSEQSRRGVETPGQANSEAALTIGDRTNTAQSDSSARAIDRRVAQAAEEGVMGFNNPTCASARAAAQAWVGTDGTYEIKSETTASDGWCLLQIRNWKSSGHASSQ
jgi:hypothetical protein